jgi:membrane protease YdiL (CAAX protease family)
MRSTHSSTIIEIFKLPRVRKPCLKDLPAFFFSLTCLLLTGLAAWGLTFVLPSGEFALFKPEGIAAWAKTAVFCLLIGYWEEGFFRMYFLTVCRRTGIKNFAAVLFSSLVFASCHSYEGLPGMINAGLAGVFLSIIYLKTESLHGTALAHTVYNILAYIFA